MSIEPITLTDDEWDEQYLPITNPFGDGERQLFETYGEELAYVQAQPVSHVWTQVDGDNGGVYIVNGYASVNRIGYYITEHPHDVHKFLSITVLDGEDE